jgi:hypothetical protein
MTCFSLRDVFWLTLVVGMGVGWWVNSSQLSADRSKWRGRNSALEDALKFNGFEVTTLRGGDIAVTKQGTEPGYIFSTFDEVGESEAGQP